MKNTKIVLSILLQCMCFGADNTSTVSYPDLLTPSANPTPSAPLLGEQPVGTKQPVNFNALQMQTNLYNPQFDSQTAIRLLIEKDNRILDLERKLQNQDTQIASLTETSQKYYVAHSTWYQNIRAYENNVSATEILKHGSYKSLRHASNIHLLTSCSPFQCDSLKNILDDTLKKNKTALQSQSPFLRTVLTTVGIGIIPATVFACYDVAPLYITGWIFSMWFLETYSKRRKKHNEKITLYNHINPLATIKNY